MHPLFTHINKYASTFISEKDFKVCLSHFDKKRIRKKQYFLQEGEISRHMAFIAVGAMRKYYLDEKGVEHIVDLYIEGWWAVDRESYVMSTPSMYNIDAVEECVVYLISRRNTFKLCSEYAPFNEFILNLDEHHQIATQRRITFSIGSSADKRYSDLVARHPYFIQRFPQHFIASYLGMSKDTLSRIRRKSLFK